MGPGRPRWPQGGPPPTRPHGESGLDSPHFEAAGASKAFGAGEVCMGGRGEGGGPLGQAHVGGGGPMVVGVATGVARAEMGGDIPPPRKGG